MRAVSAGYPPMPIPRPRDCRLDRGISPSPNLEPVPAPSWLEESYDAFPRIEEAFHAALDVSLQPRGPELLYDLVEDLGLPPRSAAVDVGCGEGKRTAHLAERFGFTVTGIDPVARHIELARAAYRMEGVRFTSGT